ncbi:Trk system potassium transporter TrkA [Azospirillum picis]|uniref:Trk system potassium uptake protein TrkA n=1 Tax=Azospirillum picis TaxID=488438 RepID=A0ABU0MJI4_9PROT|nr:Trk system potassium transporter TrkA [Azospirillum picis]MBP2299826.1 trk system potassium uptake protein TrkA [Azospirillum picis]MDQ0533622.1 trk system potassium uptake protein TrkA [Azospirillum picis]
MKVIICGAGQVGASIARHLAQEDNDVTVIDTSPELAQRMDESHDVRGMVGYASHPDVLARAGGRDADMLIAVTHSDEVNMVACQVAHSVFDIPVRVARIRKHAYLRPEWSKLFADAHMPISVIISPEIEIARSIARRLRSPGAFEMVPLADGKVHLVGVHCTNSSPLLNTPLRRLTEMFPDVRAAVLAVFRDGNGFVPDGDDALRLGDDVHLVCRTADIVRVVGLFGNAETPARRLVIAGGGNVGFNLAQIVERQMRGISMKIIEANAEQAETISQHLRSSTVVLNGDALDHEILEEAQVGRAETVVAVTNDDETNVFTSLLAKRAGCGRAITLLNKTAYAPIIAGLGMNVVVNPAAVTVSSILRHVRRGRVAAVQTIGDGFGEVVEAEALETSRAVSGPIGSIGLPDGMMIGALVRGDEVIIPTGQTLIQPRDRVIVMATADLVRKVERLFAVGLEFF